MLQQQDDDLIFQDLPNSYKGVQFVTSFPYQDIDETFQSASNLQGPSRSLNFEPANFLVGPDSGYAGSGGPHYWLTVQSKTNLLKVPLNCHVSHENAGELFFTCAGAGTTAARFQFNRLHQINISLMGQIVPGDAVECLKIDPKALGIEFGSLEAMDVFLNHDGVETNQVRSRAIEDVTCEEGEAVVSARFSNKNFTVVVQPIISSDKVTPSVVLDTSPLCLRVSRVCLLSSPN